jgi:hypothetical protein
MGSLPAKVGEKRRDEAQVVEVLGRVESEDV